MLSKNNRKLQERKLQEKQRFGFRKYSFGLASALIGVSFMLGTGSTVSADTTTTPANNSTAETKNVAVGPEASNTAPDGSATTDANRTSAKNDKTASDDSKTETIDDSAKKSIDSASSSQNNTSTTNAQTESAQTDKQDSAAPAAAQTETAEAASATEKMTVNTAASDSVPSNQLAQSKATVRKNAIMLAASTTTVNDNAAKAEGKITDEGTAKGLEKSDVAPGMSDDNGASLVADNSNIPSGYKADPTEGRYTVGIVSLGGDFDKWVKGDSSKYKSYNGENNTHYYLRFSTSKNATNGTYDSTVYSQVVDATTDTVKWEQALTPNSGAVKINNGTDGFELSSKVAGVTQYYELKYTDTKIGNASTSRIAIIPNNGSLTAVTVYSNGKAIPAGSATPGTYTSVMFPATGVIKTEYIARDAAKKETTLATYEEGGRQGYTYTISDPRVIKGYDLISSPSTTTGILGKTYNVGDVYAGGNLELSDQLQLARVYVATSEYGDAKVEVRVALKKDADGNAITISSVNDPNIWKTILTTDSLAPGATASNGNYGGGASYYINGTDGRKYITDAGFTEDQLAGYKSHLTVIILANGLTQGQEPAKYYYAPQGQVRVNYVTSDGTAIQAPVTAYKNSGTGTAYDVTGSTYKPDTITVNGKTYRYVGSDSLKGKAGTTEVNGYTYNVIPSDVTGIIKSNTLNDVYYVYELVTYSLKKDEESKTVTRTINYVDSVTGEAIPAELEPSVTQKATLTRSVIYDNKGNKIGYGTVSEDGSSYTLDDSWKVADQTWTKQDSADLSDYGYTAPDKATVEAETVDGSTTDTTVTVYYGHQTVPVTSENPGTPGKPINPKGNVKYPDGVSKDDLTSAVTRTINYVDEDGKAVNGSPDGTSSYVQKAEFTRTAILDKVTGKILGYDTDNDGKVDTESKDRAWTPTEKTLEAVKSADPSSVGYDKVDKSTVESLLVTPGQADTTVTVTYSNKQVAGTIKYIDVTTGVELDSDTLPTGKVGSKINYKTKGKIKSYEDQGYELVSSDFTDGSQVYEKEGNDFVVKLKHKTQTITPNDPNPVTPGEPINPNDPNSPVYGEETDRKNLVKDASQTIHYVGAGDNTPADNVVTQKDAFTRTVTIDKVTGKVLSYTDWTGEKTFNTVGTPVVEGYHADKKVAGGLTATVDNPDVEETVTYAPNGKLVPVDPKGTPIPGADTPTYKNDPDDPSKVVPNEPTPDVPGYKTDVPNVTPEDPTKDTPVPYTKNETPAAKYGLTEKFVDVDGNELSPSVSKGTDYKTGDKYDVTKDAKVITGYVLVKTTDTTGTFEKSDKTAVFTYKKLGKIVPVDPKGNPIPGTDTPTYKNDPDDPSKVVPNEPTPKVPGYKTDVPKVTPEDPTKDTPVPYTKNETPAAKYGLTEKFVDEDGNELLPSVNKGTDYKTGDKYDVTKDAKVITGYVLVKTTDTTGTFEKSDKTAVFTYKKLGKIVPVDPKGTPIPGADTPTYKNDPDDPSKVVPNEPTPDVPGYKTDIPKVTPEDPTKDTTVPYTKDETPAAKYGLTEKFVDEDGNELSPSVNKGTDYKTGDKYDVTKDAKVITGYVLVKTTDTAGTFEKSDKTAVFTYKKIGKIVPVDPKGTPIPGADTPSYKNDPTDPSKVVPNEPTPKVPGYKTDVPNVTPEDPTKDTPVPYTKNETPAAKYGLTEKFVDVDGSELSPSVSKGTDYKTGDKYDVTKDAKVITGYVLVKTTDTTGTFEKSDKTAVFTYKKIGKIVPVDPKGTPIPGADKPTYKNDPDDPSKVVPNEPTPDVPVYKTDVPNVTPEDPTKDTPVPYTKNETPAAKYGLTEKFVDVDGNELSPSVSKGTDYKTGDKYDVTKDAKVITGYVLVKTTDTTGTFTDSDKTAVFTYKKIGKIVPVDPSGNPIPGADTPTYKNDPDDPSKVVPNEPTPDVPGYKADVPNVTPEDPTKDTPVPYTKNETPAAKYGLTEKFVDEDGNELSPSESKGTDYKTGNKYDVTKDAKVITGYVLVKSTDTTGTFSDGNKTAVFTYKKIGKIVPVDPSGNPIPGADTPTYKNDPDDPSKVVPNEPTPSVPGYKTDVPNVTPEDPTKDTPVPYTKNETPVAKYGLTEKFVDEDGNELLPTESKGDDYKTGDKYDVTKDAKVITGYVLVKTTDTTGTFTDGNKTAVFTYKKIGKIVPVDPKGNPIPGADTPTYKNDPDDPSKVVPNESTPDVPGYKTDVPNVTPEDPTKDTPVPYTKDEKGETPSTPEGPTSPSNPESPQGPSQSAKPAAAPKQTTFTPNSGKQTPAQGKTATASQLPQTGADEEKASLLSAVGLGAIALASLFVLLGGKKRKH